MAVGKNGSRTRDEENAQRSTLNAQRPMRESDSTIERWVLDVGRCAFASVVRIGVLPGIFCSTSRFSPDSLPFGFQIGFLLHENCRAGVPPAAFFESATGNGCPTT